MTESKRYHKISEKERIEDSDRIAVMELEKELRKEIKKKYYLDIPQYDLKDLIEAWLKKYRSKP